MVQEKIEDLLESDAGNRFLPVLRTLFSEVQRTKNLAADFATQAQAMTSSWPDLPPNRPAGNINKRKFRYARTILHPSEDSVNIFFLMAILVKWCLFAFSFIWACMLSFNYHGDTFNKFAYASIPNIISTLSTIAEILFHLHVGYVDPATGRIVMEPIRVYRHYIRSKTKFALDVVSLIPIWLIIPLTLPLSSKPVSFWSNLLHRFVRLLPLSTILLQLGRSMSLFRQPPQAQPFNRKILTAKYCLKVLIIILSVFILFALLWIVAGCQNTLLLKECEINGQGGWIRIVQNQTEEVYVDNSFAILMSALNFVVSVATGAGFGDVSAHNKEEIMIVILMIIVLTFVNCELQAQVLTALYAEVLRQVRATIQTKKMRHPAS